MAGFRTPCVGLLVGVSADAWENRDDKRSGVSYRAYVSQGFQVPPVEVTIGPAEHEACMKAGQFAKVESVVEMKAYGRTGGGAVLAAKAVSFQVEAQAPAPAGRS